MGPGSEQESEDAPQAARLAVVIVTHDSREALGRTLPAVLEELRPGDEVVVVDNASADGTPELARRLLAGAEGRRARAEVIETGANLGYGGANNRGAGAASAELLCFLNPDAAPAPGFREAIAAPLRDRRGWAAWQGLVTAQEGQVVNTRGGVAHFTGIAWAGGAGDPIGPAADGSAEPAFVSGACLAIPRERFRELGGFAEEFFLYQEDVDLSFRLRLSGGRLGVAPLARADHEYEFEKGPQKWRYLERNRWATIVRTYPAPLLVAVAPALLATELALFVVAAAGGWLGPKARAWRETIAWMPRLMRERRAVQATRAIGAGDFAAALTPALDSTYLGAAGRSRLLGAGLRAYWALVLALLGGGRGRG